MRCMLPQGSNYYIISIHGYDVTNSVPTFIGRLPSRLIRIQIFENFTL